MSCEENGHEFEYEHEHESEFWSENRDRTLSWEMGVLTGNGRDETQALDSEAWATGGSKSSWTLLNVVGGEG